MVARKRKTLIYYLYALSHLKPYFLDSVFCVSVFVPARSQSFKKVSLTKIVIKRQQKQRSDAYDGSHNEKQHLI